MWALQATPSPPPRAPQSCLLSVFNSAFPSSESGTEVAKKHDGRCVEEVSQVSGAWRKIRVWAGASCTTWANSGWFGWCSLHGGHTCAALLFVGEYHPPICRNFVHFLHTVSKRKGRGQVRIELWDRQMINALRLYTENPFPTALCHSCCRNLAECFGNVGRGAEGPGNPMLSHCLCFTKGCSAKIRKLPAFLKCWYLRHQGIQIHLWGFFVVGVVFFRFLVFWVFCKWNVI